MSCSKEGSPQRSTSCSQCGPLPSPERELLSCSDGVSSRCSEGSLSSCSQEEGSSPTSGERILSRSEESSSSLFE